MLVESESKLCNRGNNTLYIYLGVRLTPDRERVSFNYPYTPTLSVKSVCGDLLTCIPLFIESVFEVLVKKKKKKKKSEKKEKKRKGANSLRLFFPPVRDGAL
jgi:hypothetical protein